MKSFKSRAGILLISLSILMFVTGIFFSTSSLISDDPCRRSNPLPHYFEQEAILEARITYCLSFYPRLFGPVTYYDFGVSGDDYLEIIPASFWHGNLYVERQIDDLVVNGHIVHPLNSYTWLRLFPSLNPWLLLAARFEVMNIGTSASAEADTVRLLGEVMEGYLPSPLGFVILGIGVWLWWRSREREAEKRI